MRVVTIKIPEDLLEMIDAIASEKKLNRSELIREVMSEYVKKCMEKKAVGRLKVEKIKI